MRNRQLYFVFGALSILCGIAGFFRLLNYSWIQQLDVYPDDAYYYLQIGWNWAKTGFVSFDGLTATNGFHPLWGAIVALLAKFCNTKDQLMQAVKVLEIVLHLATALMATRLPFVKKESKPLVFALVASCLSIQFVSHQGMESGIYALVLIGFLGSYSGIVEKQSKSEVLPLHSYLTCGVWAALCLYSRLDASLLLSLIVALGIARTRKSWFLPSSISAAVAFGLPLCSIGLWIVFSKNHVGSYMMDSALAKGVFAKYEHATQGPAGWAAYALGVTAIRGLAQPVLLTIAPAALLLILSRRGTKSSSGTETRPITPEWMGIHFIAANCLMFLVVGILSTHIQWWYIASGTACVIYWLSAKVSSIELDDSKAIAGWVGVLACSAFFAVKSVHTYPIQSKASPQMIRFSESLPEGTRVGYYDSGAAGFYVKGRTIVNLDGLVNSKVRRHLQAGTYERIADELGIDVFGQFPKEMYQGLGARKLKLETLKHTDGSSFYRVLNTTESPKSGTPTPD